MELIARPVLRLGLRQVLRTKKFFIVVIVTLLPLLAGLLLLLGDVLASRHSDVVVGRGATEMVAFFVLGGTVPFTALLLAGGLLADDAEDRTLTYLLVRPVRRRVLYLSKAGAVLLLTGILAAVQAMLLLLARLLSHLLVGSGGPIEYMQPDGGFLRPFVDACSTCPATIGSGQLLAMLLVPAMVDAFLLGIGLAAFFGFVSIVTTRFHFFANLLIYVSWELPFGNMGPAPGILTFTYHAQSLLARFDPTSAHAFPDALSPLLAAPAMLLGTLGWLAAGAWLVGRRDFNITSATS